MMIQDQLFMKQALDLARLGTGQVSPNPRVGCVLVKDGCVIGQGYHEKFGEPHAEANALAQARQSVEGATLYCNLEPCCHTHKKTPPCAQRIIEAKISRVVIAQLDPNPLVAGRGVALLREAGIEVEVGVLEDDALELNRSFNKWIDKGLPYIHLKIAQGFDGRMVLDSGESKWISDTGAREYVHKLRLEYDAVMIGRETLNNDNPNLSVRLVDSMGKIPYRIIVGSLDKMNTDSTLFTDGHKDRTLILGPSKNKDRALELGIKSIELTSWENSLRELASLGVSSILVEGGPTLVTTLLEERLFDRVTLFSCPVLMGNGRSFFESKTTTMSDVLRLKDFKSERVGNQIKIEFDAKDFL